MFLLDKQIDPEELIDRNENSSNMIERETENISFMPESQQPRPSHSTDFT
jgi:hypothetical protein